MKQREIDILIKEVKAQLAQETFKIKKERVKKKPINGPRTLLYKILSNYLT